VESSPTCANGRVFFGTMGGVIYALDEFSGLQVWSWPLSGYKIVSTAAADNASIYVATMGGGGGGMIYAFNQPGGPPEWVSSLVGPPSNFSSSPAIDVNRNLVLLGSDTGYVYALNRLTGTPVWSSAPVGQINMSSVAISGDGLAYIGSTNGNLACLNETSGALVWTCSIGASVIASPALIDHHVIISSNGTTGSVECIGPAFPVYDSAVCNLTGLPAYVFAGTTISINCTFANNGNVNETFQAGCLYSNVPLQPPPLFVDPTPLYMENVTLPPGTNTTITFSWNTTGFSPGTYMIIAVSTPMVGETNSADNIFLGSRVEVMQIAVGGGGSRVPYLD